MRPCDNISGFLLPISIDGLSSNIITSSDSEDTNQASSTQDVDVTDVCRDLEYAGVRFRRIRDDILENFRKNFRRMEDVLSEWNKECLEMSHSKKSATAKGSKSALCKNIKEALDGLREIEVLGKTASLKFGKVLNELTMKSGSSY